MGNITDKLSYLNDTKKAIKNAITSRGVTVSDNDTFRDYASKITEIGETVNKIKFGASTDTFIGDVDENGVLQEPTAQTTLNFAGVKEIAANGLYYAFYRRKGITSVDLSSLQSVGYDGMSHAFNNCTGITGALDLSSLTTVNSYGMENAFSNCSGITSVDLSSLQSVMNSSLSMTFYRCTSLTTISFPSLTSVQTSSFNNSTFDACPNLTEIHFRADMQATIEAMSYYSSKFGATNATIYFDL